MAIQHLPGESTGRNGGANYLHGIGGNISQPRSKHQIFCETQQGVALERYSFQIASFVVSPTDSFFALGVHDSFSLIVLLVMSQLTSRARRPSYCFYYDAINAPNRLNCYTLQRNCKKLLTFPGLKPQRRLLREIRQAENPILPNTWLFRQLNVAGWRRFDSQRRRHRRLTNG